MCRDEDPRAFTLEVHFLNSFSLCQTASISQSNCNKILEILIVWFGIDMCIIFMFELICLQIISLASYRQRKSNVVWQSHGSPAHQNNYDRNRYHIYSDSNSDIFTSVCILYNLNYENFSFIWNLIHNLFFQKQNSAPIFQQILPASRMSWSAHQARCSPSPSTFLIWHIFYFLMLPLFTKFVQNDFFLFSKCFCVLR